MGVGVGIPHPCCDDGDAELPAEEVDRAGSCHHRENRRTMPVDPLRRLDGHPHEGVFRVSRKGRFPFPPGDLHIGEALRIQMGPEGPKNSLRILLRYQAEIQFRHSLRRKNSLGAWTPVAAVEAIYIARRSKDEPFLQRVPRQPIQERVNPIEGPDFLLRVLPVGQGGPLSGVGGRTAS